MAYEVIKTISGRQYRYLQETYRESGRVRTRNTYLGPVDGGVRRRGGVTGFCKAWCAKRIAMTSARLKPKRGNA